MTFKSTKCIQLVNAEQILLCPIICFKKHSWGIMPSPHRTVAYSHSRARGNLMNGSLVGLWRTCRRWGCITEQHSLPLRLKGPLRQYHRVRKTSNEETQLKRIHRSVTRPENISNDIEHSALSQRSLPFPFQQHLWLLVKGCRQPEVHCPAGKGPGE